MGTSLSAGEILYDFSELAADRFVDTALMRDLVDTALHKADEFGQVRLHWAAPKSTVWVENNDPFDVITGGDRTTDSLDVGSAEAPIWYFFGARSFYCPKVRADGSGYKLRVYMAGCSSDGGEVDFGMLVMPGRARNAWLTWGGTPGDGSTGYPVAAKLFSGITSTTPAKLTPDDASNILTVSSAMIEAAYRLESVTSTLVDIGGAPTSIIMPTLEVIPFAQTLNSGTVPRLYLANAAEFVGQT